VTYEWYIKKHACENNDEIPVSRATENFLTLVASLWL